MKKHIQLLVTMLSLTLLFLSCKKNKEVAPSPIAINNTSWMANITITGYTTTQNIFEFGGNESVFAWHPVGAVSFSGSWTQTGSTVNFIFKESTPTKDYFWDNTGTLSSDGMTYTGTMKRRGAEGTGTFTAKKM